jgi:hypothetical protein
MTFQVAVAMAAYYAAALLVLAALWAATDARPPFRLGLVGICALAMLLFVDPFGAIRQDSFQHAGLAGQFRQAISEGDYFPLSVNTAAIIGDQAGMWNGHLLYLAAGYIGLLVGGSAALKLIIIAVFALQCWYVWSACREIGLSDFPALALTAAICVTAYALNNLYVRGAFPEFVATSLVAAPRHYYLSPSEGKHFRSRMRSR